MIYKLGAALLVMIAFSAPASALQNPPGFSDGAVPEFSPSNIDGPRLRPMPVADPLRMPVDKDFDMGFVYFLINPLGFLTIGPVIEVGIIAAELLSIGVHVRFGGLGLLIQAIATDFFSTDVEMNFFSLAPGVSLIYLLKYANSPNRIYLGASMDYFLSWGDNNVGEALETDWRTNVLIFLANVGHRWRFPSGFFLSAGAFVGFGADVVREWWYIDFTVA